MDFISRHRAIILLHQLAAPNPLTFPELLAPDFKEHVTFPYPSFGDMSRHENSSSIILEIKLPGLTRDDIKIEYGDTQLSISAEIIAEKKEAGYYSKKYSKWVRHVLLPPEVKLEDIKADFGEEVLKITIPKPVSLQEQEKERTVIAIEEKSTSKEDGTNKEKIKDKKKK